MCGRFTYKLTWPELMRLYRLTAPARNPQPRYNVCPTDTIERRASYLPLAAAGGLMKRSVRVPQRSQAYITRSSWLPQTTGSMSITFICCAQPGQRTVGYSERGALIRRDMAEPPSETPHVLA
jgi:hypothetical protein